MRQHVYAQKPVFKPKNVEKKTGLFFVMSGLYFYGVPLPRTSPAPGPRFSLQSFAALRCAKGFSLQSLTRAATGYLFFYINFLSLK